MIFGTLGASLSGNLLPCKGVKAEIPGQGVTKVVKGTILAAQDF